MYSSTVTTILARPDHGRSIFAWCGYRDTANAASEIRYCSVPPRTTSTLAFRLGTALSSRAHAFFCRLCKLMQEDDGENPALQYFPYVICAIIHVYTSLPPYTTMQLPSLILQLGAFNNVRIRYLKVLSNASSLAKTLNAYIIRPLRQQPWARPVLRDTPRQGFPRSIKIVDLMSSQCRIQYCCECDRKGRETERRRGDCARIVSWRVKGTPLPAVVIGA